MAAQYTVKIVTDFSAAHLLRDYLGECSRLHGHNWKIEVEAVASQLDTIGMAIDFKVLKQAIRQITAKFDHYNLNDIPPFNEINPTAENIAAHFYKALSTVINTTRVQISSVTIWETERACICYSEVKINGDH